MTPHGKGACLRSDRGVGGFPLDGVERAQRVPLGRVCRAGSAGEFVPTSQIRFRDWLEAVASAVSSAEENGGLPIVRGQRFVT